VKEINSGGTPREKEEMEKGGERGTRTEKENNELKREESK
jgi:hypothetical protein